MAMYHACGSDESIFWSIYTIEDRKTQKPRRMRWTELWKKETQNRKDRDEADVLALYEHFVNDAAGLKELLKYKKGGKWQQMKSKQHKARKWREFQGSLLPHDQNSELDEPHNEEEGEE
jgi:hypothetical protein